MGAYFEEHYFWTHIPDDCKKAISELRRMKVNNLLARDMEETFADVWWLVLHEVDMYAEGEFCREASRSYYGEGEPNAMNMKQAQAADRWLVRWNELAIKYSLPGNFTEYHDKHISNFGDEGVCVYGGQLI